MVVCVAFVRYGYQADYTRFDSAEKRGARCTMLGKDPIESYRIVLDQDLRSDTPTASLLFRIVRVEIDGGAALVMRRM